MTQRFDIDWIELLSDKPHVLESKFVITHVKCSLTPAENRLAIDLALQVQLSIGEMRIFEGALFSIAGPMYSEGWQLHTPVVCDKGSTLLYRVAPNVKDRSDLPHLWLLNQRWSDVK